MLNIFVMVKYKSYEYKSTEIKISQNKIYFFGEKCYLKPVTFNRITNIKLYENQLMVQLTGDFETIYEKVEWIFFKFDSTDKMTAFKNALQEKHRIEASLFVLENEQESREFKVFLLKEKNMLSVETEDEKRLLYFNLEELVYIYNQKTLIIYFTDRCYYLKLTSDLDLADHSFGKKLLTNVGEIYGYNKESTFSGESFDIVIHYLKPETFMLVPSLLPTLVGSPSNLYQVEVFIKSHSGMKMIPANTYRMQRLANYRLLKVQGNEDSLYLIDSATQSDLLAKAFAMFNDDNIYGYTQNKQPFELVIEGDRLRLTREGIPTELQFKDIQNLTILGEQKQDMVQVNLSLTEDFECYLPKEIIKDLMTKLYKEKKKPLLQQSNTPTLFSSYGRQMNDFLLYQYFGQLVSLKAGVDEINQSQSNRKERNQQVLNFLYYGIQAQKKRLDMISVYFPALLHRYDENFLQGNRQEIDDIPYRKMQRKLISLTSQLQRHLNEIERSLSAVSFALIPQSDMSNFIKTKTNHGYGSAAVTGVVGIFFPPLLVASALMGARTYLGKREMEQLEKIKEENRKQQIEFHVSNALDNFHHFYQSMFPYYLNEINQILFQTMNETKKHYVHLLESEAVKMKIFNLMANLYTFKQMPIDQTVLTSKQELITEIHKIGTFNESHIAYLLEDIGGKSNV
jgi:hypothetical protein